jgi:hypothetical protein
MDGLMSPQAQKMLAILEELQFGENASGAFRTGNLGSGNPVGRVEKMIGAGAGGPGMMGRWQEASGKPLWSFQDPGSMELQPQGMPQQQMQPQQGAPAMPGQDPMVQKQVALFEMFMKEVADDPYMTEEEKITWANVKVQELMGGLQ